MTQFSFGAVIVRAFNMIGRSFASVGVLIIGAQAIMAAIQFAFIRPIMIGAMSGQPSALALFTSPTYWLAIAASLFVFSALFAGATHGFLLVGEGKQAEFGDCLRVALMKAFPVLGLTILWSLGVWLGMILFLIPGLILMTMWSVCIPALVSGETGVFGSFGRSRDLTKGARLKIFALLLLVLVAYYAMVSLLLGSVIGPAGPVNISGAMAATMTPGALAGSLITGTVFMFLLPALMAAIYIEAVSVRFGTRDSTVAEVFA